MGFFQDGIYLIDILNVVGGFHIRRNMGVLQSGKIRVDMEGCAEAHPNGADHIPRDGIAHIGAMGGIGLHLMEILGLGLRYPVTEERVTS